MHALKSRETRRQYPQRLKVFLDFLNPSGGILDEQAMKWRRITWQADEHLERSAV